MSKTPSLVQESGIYLLYRPSYSQFCVENPNFVTTATVVPSKTSYNDIIKFADPEHPIWYRILGIISYGNRVIIANTAVRSLIVVFGESGSPLLLIQPLSDLVQKTNDHQRLTACSCRGRKSLSVRIYIAKLWSFMAKRAKRKLY